MCSHSLAHRLSNPAAGFAVRVLSGASRLISTNISVEPKIARAHSEHAESESSVWPALPAVYSHRCNRQGNQHLCTSHHLPQICSCLFSCQANMPYLLEYNQGKLLQTALHAP